MALLDLPYGVEYMVLLDILMNDVVHFDTSNDGDLMIEFNNGDIVLFGNMINGHKFWTTTPTSYCEYCGEHEARHLVGGSYGC